MSWEQPASVFAGAFLGVLSGFGSSYLYGRYQDRNKRIQALKWVLYELRTCEGKQEGVIMPIETWQALMSSGIAMLLDNRMLDSKDIGLMALTKTYNRIRDCNNKTEMLISRKEFVKARALGEESLFTEEVWMHINEKLRELWIRESQRLHESYNETIRDVSDKIKKLEQEINDC